MDCNRFSDEELVRWADQQFSIKIPLKELSSLIRSKNGPIFIKLFEFFTDHINSKRNGTLIKRHYDYVNCCKELVVVEKEIELIKINICKLSSEFSQEQRKLSELKKTEAQVLDVIATSTATVDIFEEMVSRINHNIEFEPNLNTVDEAVDSYNRLFVQPTEIAQNKNANIKASKSRVYCDSLINKINSLVTNINEILYDINEFEEENVLNFDFDKDCFIQNLTAIELKKLEGVKQEKSILQKKEDENDFKRDLCKSVDNLANQYNEIRLEQTAKLRDKIIKTIVNCDGVLKKKLQKQ